MDLVWTVPYCITDEDAEFGNIVTIKTTVFPAERAKRRV